MKPPKKIYAKAEKQNGEEVLRLSTSPFLKDNIEYIRKDIAYDGGTEWKEYCFALARSSVFVIVILLAIIACLLWNLYS